MRPALAMLLVAFIVSPAGADPLDDWCKTARLPSSIAICGDAELRTLAIERSRAFVEAEARLSPDEQKALLADQNDWVRSYARVCGLPEMPSALTLAPEVKACMARAGWARIAYLRAYGSFSASPPMGQASAPFAQTPPASATVASNPTRIGPSFDCNKASSPLALMICASPALSKVDLRFVQAYQALWQQVGKEGQRQLLAEAVDFQNAVLHACRIPETGPVSGSPECVAAEYERQRSIWLSRLNGPASEEASRPIEQQIALQARLQKLGFLPAAVTIDGVYGEATRSSILAWQGVNRRPQTGFLDDADATALAGARETEATPATQSPSPGQGVPGVGSALEAAAAAQPPIQPATVAPAAPPLGQTAPTPGSLRPQTDLAAATRTPDAPGPAGFDILGMKLGMTVEEIEGAINAYDPSLKIRVDKVLITGARVNGSDELRNFGVAKFVQLFVRTAAVAGGLDNIEVAFTVTEPGRALYIRRSASFRPGQEPLMEKTVQQLKEKYGSARRSLAIAQSPSIALYWIFDQAGSPIDDGPNGGGTCRGEFFYSTIDPRYSLKCGVEMLVQLGPATDPQLLSTLNEQLIGDSIAVDDIQKIAAEVKADQEQLRQQQEQKASGVKPPL